MRCLSTLYTTFYSPINNDLAFWIQLQKITSSLLILLHHIINILTNKDRLTEIPLVKIGSLGSTQEEIQMVGAHNHLRINHSSSFVASSTILWFPATIDLILTSKATTLIWTLFKPINQMPRIKYKLWWHLLPPYLMRRDFLTLVLHITYHKVLIHS